MKNKSFSIDNSEKSKNNIGFINNKKPYEKKVDLPKNSTNNNSENYDTFNRSVDLSDNSKIMSIFDMIDEDKLENTLSELEDKVRNGETLTIWELNILKKYSPDLYQLAIAIKEERDSIVSRLKSCNTKADVEEVMASIKSSSLEKLKNASKSGNELAMAKEKALLKAVDDDYEEIKKSETYKNLPDN